MDAVKYLQERTRMCRSIISCTDCPFDETQSGHGMNCGAFTMYYPEEAVRVVEEWSKAHPVQTNAQKFKEVFGSSMNIEQLFEITTERLGEYTLPSIKDGIWWDEPYKEPENE